MEIYPRRVAAQQAPQRQKIRQRTVKLQNHQQIARRFETRALPRLSGVGASNLSGPREQLNFPRVPRQRLAPIGAGREVGRSPKRTALENPLPPVSPQIQTDYTDLPFSCRPWGRFWTAFGGAALGLLVGLVLLLTLFFSDAIRLLWSL